LNCLSGVVIIHNTTTWDRSLFACIELDNKSMLFKRCLLPRTFTKTACHGLHFHCGLSGVQTASIRDSTIQAENTWY